MEGKLAQILLTKSNLMTAALEVHNKSSERCIAELVPKVPRYCPPEGFQITRKCQKRNKASDTDITNERHEGAKLTMLVTLALVRWTK